MFTEAVCDLSPKGRHSSDAFSERLSSLPLVKRPEKTPLVIPLNVRQILPSSLQDMEDDFRFAQILSSTGTLWRALSCSYCGSLQLPQAKPNPHAPRGFAPYDNRRTLFAAAHNIHLLSIPMQSLQSRDCTGAHPRSEER